MGTDVVPVEVKDNKDGGYSASFVTKQVREAKVSITIEGEHIKGIVPGVPRLQKHRQGH